MGNLTAIGVLNLTKPGRYYDGDNLALEISPGGSKSWCFLYMRHRKSRQMGLGPLSLVSLSDARKKAREYKVALLDGIDPFDHRAAKRVATATVTFKECATDFIAVNQSHWRNRKHANQWRATLLGISITSAGKVEERPKTHYAKPLCPIRVGAITRENVVDCLQPIWRELPETANRVRSRIEAVLDAAAARGLREVTNPARWDGLLEVLLPRGKAVPKVRHHPAIEIDALPQFMAELREREGVSPLAFRFLILTAARTSEVTGARWSEISLDDRLWTISAGRMKASREHRIPLTDPALAILTSLDRKQGDDHALLFPGAKEGRPLSNMSFIATLKRMERKGITPHGMRSTFRDWVSERTDFPGEVAEMALAHVIPSKVEKAYRRGDLLTKRRELMEAWARFCDPI